VLRTLAEAVPYVAVFHVADYPRRHDPGTGEMNYPEIYKAIQTMGYSGYVTMEYLSLGSQIESLSKAVAGLKAAWGISEVGEGDWSGAGL
jgi:hydroxypyruvate isomerase